MDTATLLIVDDDRGVLHALYRYFRRAGYEVSTAESGEQGLAVLQQTPVDVIITDQRMPGMSGIEFLQRCALDHATAIHFLLTGYADVTAAIHAVNSGVVYKYLVKPWQNEDLDTLIRQALQHRGGTGEAQTDTPALKRRNALHQELERRHPGITRRPPDGVFRISCPPRRLPMKETAMGILPPTNEMAAVERSAVNAFQNKDEHDG